MRRVYLLFGVVAFAIAASAPPVSARDKGQGYYFDIGPSYAVFGDSELSSGAELSAEDGLGAAVAIGYRYGGGFRSEFEVGFRRNDLDSVSAAGTFFGTAVAANAALNGDVSTAYGLINLYYDIDMRSAWSPYVGAGIGGASVELDSTTLDVDDTDTVLAYQALIGASYRISDNVWARGGYRYFATSDPEIAGAEFEVQNHILGIGLQIGFVAF